MFDEGYHRILWLSLTLLCSGSSSSRIIAGAAAAAAVTDYKVDAALDEHSDTTNSSDDTTTVNQCTVYMAPSTIPGAGLGIYTGIERKSGDTVGDGDVILPISDHWYVCTSNIPWIRRNSLDASGIICRP
jgi:hypothetical protein